MTSSGNAPKKPKEKRQTPAERQEALRYNQMMYGPTAGERRAIARKVHQGSAYLQHPKFTALMSAFRKGAPFRFDVTEKAKSYTLSTDGTNLCVDSKVLFYARPSNRHEDHLLLDRAVLLQYQTVDAVLQFAAAVMRSLPDLDARPLSTLGPQLFYGPDALDADLESQGPNLMIGAYRHGRAAEKPRK